MEKISKTYLFISGMIGIFIQWIVENNYVEPFLAIGVVFTMDTFLGIWKAFKQRRFNSRCFANLFRKIIIYFGSILVLVLLHKFISLGLLKEAVNITIGAIIFNELLSSVENLIIINPKTKVLMQNILTFINNIKNNNNAPK